jgi:serine/threonine protein kinase
MSRAEELTTFGLDQWQRLSPYLDQALEMIEEERSLWLSSIRSQDPGLAQELETLLQEYHLLSKEDFLEKRSVSLPGKPGLAGQELGVYTLISQIGHGGMGSVWLAKRNDGRFERQVAVKFLNISLLGTGGEERFRREGNILGRLAHPHIAELIDAGVTTTGQPYLVLENVDGHHVDRYCDDHKLGLTSRVRLFLDVLAAVAHAHANLIVHRDIKPSNVLVGNDGSVKLLDFGVAKLLEDEGRPGAPTLTVDGGRALTPEYAAPEQLKGEPVTTATDVYALGVLLYELLTGQHPVGPSRHTPAALVSAVLDKEPTRPSEVFAQAGTNSDARSMGAASRATTPDKLRRLLRGDLDTIVAKALKKEPAERYASVTAFADDLRRYLRNEPISARADTLTYRCAKFVRRNRMAVTLATLAVLATAGGVVGTLVQTRNARAQRDFALSEVARGQALNDFHEFLLSEAAPSGKPFTVNDLLGRAEKIVEHKPTVQDPNRVVLMISIGHQYLEQDEADKGRKVLEEAYTLSLASCNLAASLARNEEIARAETLFQEGLGELPESPQFALERINCLHDGAEVALVQGGTAEALARAQEAQSVLRKSPFDSNELEMQRWLDLATVYSAAGKDLEAVSAFEQVSGLLSSLGRDNTETAAVAFNNWAMELDQLGRPLEAEKMYRRAISIERAGQTEEAVSPLLLADYARNLQELGRLSEASDYAMRAYLKAQRVGLQMATDIALLERARIYRAQNNPSRAATILAEVEPRLRQNLPPVHYAFATLASEKALIDLQRGDLRTALKLADQAVSMDEAAIKGGGEGAYYLPSLLINRSAVELESQRTDRAIGDASRALGLLQGETQPAPSSSIRGRAFLALGRGLEAAGRHEFARGAFHSALDNLQDTVGPDHPDTRAARLLAGR